MDAEVMAMTPDERLQKGLCPECGKPLEGVAVATHGLEHWPTTIFPNGANGEAIRRQKMLNEYKEPTKAAPEHKSPILDPKR